NGGKKHGAGGSTLAVKMIVGHVLSLLANARGRLRIRVGVRTFESLRVPILLPDTLYANLRKSVASRNYGHKDLRLWEYEKPRIHGALEKRESPEIERVCPSFKNTGHRPLSFQRILNNGGASEEGGKAEEDDISRVLERGRRGSKRRGPENAAPERSGC
ncbi:hypothetical protein ALC57_03554, partial [Trachymyrmex cornetzi]